MNFGLMGWGMRWWRVTAVVLAAAGVLSSSASADPVCTRTWVGGATGAWNAGANWSGGAVPGSADRACVGAGVTVSLTQPTTVGSVSGAGSVTVDGGNVTLADSSAVSEIGSLSFVNTGVLSGSSVWHVTSALSMTSASIGASSRLVVDTGAAGTLSGGTIYGTVTNYGTVSVSGRVLGRTGAVFDNQGTLRVNMESGGNALDRYVSGDVPSLRNSGTIIKDSGTGWSSVGWTIANAGTIKATTGTLNFLGGTGSTVYAHGEWLSSGGTVSLGGNYNTGFDLGFDVSFHGTISSATVTAAGFRADSVLAMSGGTLALSSGQSVSSLLMLSNGSGTIAGTAPLHVTGLLDVSSGSIAAGGQLVLDAGATGTLRSGTLFGTLTNAGTLSLVGNVGSAARKVTGWVRQPGGLVWA